MSPEIENIIKDCSSLLRHHYGERFAGLVLYGSTARGDDEFTSDLDLLALISDPFNYFVELRMLTDLLYPLQLRSPRTISVRPASIDDYQSGALQLYRNAQREGIRVT